MIAQIDWSATAALAVGFLTAVVGSWLAWKQSKLEHVTTEEAHEADKHGMLIDQLQEEVTRLRDDLGGARDEIRAVYVEFSALRARLIEIETGARILTAQLVEEGHDPRWEMPPFRMLESEFTD